MDKIKFIKEIIPNHLQLKEKAWAFAPSNIALCKYWGKSCNKLNLPSTSSLSISLGSRGSFVVLKRSEKDTLKINNIEISTNSSPFIKAFQFIDLFRKPNEKFLINSWNNLPTAAGLATSASFFAALTLALNNAYDWKILKSDLSLIARLGSGSACRSIEHGFIEWERNDNPFKSYGNSLNLVWPELCIGILIVDETPKLISSSDAMLHTSITSPFYKAWADQSIKDFKNLKQKLEHLDFNGMGEIVEANALSLHAAIMTSRPAIIYSKPGTLDIIEKIRKARNSGVDVYFTQDAGPNIKIIFLEKDLSKLKQLFPNLMLIRPFLEIPLKNSAPFVICVDQKGVSYSFEEKNLAHKNKVFHRAISVLLYRKTSKGIEVLLQKRHPDKYHSGGLWSNTCCSHPQLYEDNIEAAQRALFEETGITTGLSELGSFIYEADFKNGLSEAEYDHLFIGEWDGLINSFNTDELTTLEWILLNKLEKNLINNPNKYTAWLPPLINCFKKEFK